MARRKAVKKKKPIENYDHKDKKRLNNPPVGLVTPDTDIDTGPKTYQYDPHIDPSLQWAGKAEHTSFEVPTVSLHVHERIDPKTIIEAVRKKNGSQPQLFFQFPEENPPLREAIDFYKHAHNWSNRLIAGDSTLVMNSLLEKEGMAGQVQMVYIDPPYGIKYGSNFQPFVNKRDVKDGKDEDLTAEPEMIKAFRDTWELGIHSYLTYLRDRLLLAKELLSESGSCFVQISDENVHLVRNLMDEVFKPENFVSTITFRKTNKALGAKLLGRVTDYIVWYAREKGRVKFRNLHAFKTVNSNPSSYKWVETIDLQRRQATIEDIEEFTAGTFRGRFFTPVPLTSSGYTESCTYSFEYKGREYTSATGKSWVTTKNGMENLIAKDRLFIMGSTPFWIQYLEELSTISYDNIWDDTRGELQKTYVVQTTSEVIRRCLAKVTETRDVSQVIHRLPHCSAT